MPKSKSLTAQQARISEHEKELLKSVFEDRDDLILTVRNLFFGFELTDKEKKELSKTFSDSAIRALMRKIFLPELDKDIPVQQSIDLWMTINFEGAHDDHERYQFVQAREKLIADLEKALALLEDVDGDTVDLNVDLDRASFYPSLIARNTFISHVELQLNAIKIMAHPESQAEIQERMKKDSAK